MICEEQCLLGSDEVALKQAEIVKVSRNGGQVIDEWEQNHKIKAGLVIGRRL